MAERIGKNIWRARVAMAALALATLLAALVVAVLACAVPAGEAHALTEGWTQSGTCEWKITDGELVVRPLDEGVEGTLASLGGSANGAPWHSQRESITSVRFEGTVYGQGNCTSMFSGCSNMTSADLSGFDTSNVTNMNSMFYGCYALASLDLGDKFDTSNVTIMNYMFYNCYALTSLDLGDKFDTSNVTNMNSMFYGCWALASLDLGDKFDTSNVTNMNSMFYNCYALTSLDLGDKFDTSNVTNMNYMFYDCWALTSLDVSKFNTSNVKNMSYMFSNCRALVSLDVSSFDTSNVTDMGRMFGDCKALASLSLGDKFDTSKVTSMGSMFYGCNALTSLSLGDKFDTSKVASMYYMFYNCNSLVSLDLGDKFDTSNVTDMGYMFSDCKALASLDLGDRFDTSKVTNMYGMFYNCNALTSLDLGDKFDTSNVTNMGSMFCHCKTITSLELGDKFDTSNVTNMSAMFNDCTVLESLDLGDKFDTSKVTDMGGMYGASNALESVTIGPHNPFVGETSSVTSALPANTKGGTCTGKWVRDDESYGPYTPAELRQNYTSAMAGTWVLEAVPTKYTLAFASDIGTGSMEQVKPVAAEDYAIPASGFVYPGKHVVSWDDGNGHVWPADGAIPANTYAAGDEITLTAVWEDLNQVKKAGKGTYEIELQPGMQATIPDVPAGTPYRVYEQTEDGWVLVQQSNTTGTIQPLQTATASFTNQYAPEVTSAVLYGMKTLDNRAAEAGSYSFELWEGDELLQTKPVVEGGAIVFDPIVYDGQGQHVYTVKEVVGDDETLTYDTHEETVTVLVQDVDAHLTARVEYDSDGVRFNNRHNPGNLLLTKDVVGQTSANADDEFTFKVTLRNPNGEPVSEGVYLHYSE